MKRKNKFYRTYQKGFTKLLRALNRNIANDNLWQGRFEFRQKYYQLEKFEDGSGGVLYACIRGYDKETGYYKDYHVQYAPYLHGNEYLLWDIANGFIVKDVNIWSHTPSPRDDGFKKNYTNLHIPDKVMQEPFNWFLNYQSWIENNKTVEQRRVYLLYYKFGT